MGVSIKAHFDSMVGLAKELPREAPFESAGKPPARRKACALPMASMGALMKSLTWLSTSVRIYVSDAGLSEAKVLDAASTENKAMAIANRKAAAFQMN